VKNDTTENEAIVATDLTKSFGEGEAKVTAVNGIGPFVFVFELSRRCRS
jgi:hypothetical protein